MPWAMRWGAATVLYLRPLSTASTAGSPNACAPTRPMPTQIFGTLHGWRRYGKRSAAPRATPQNTIWSENRWCFRCSGCLRKQRGSRAAGDHPRPFCLSDKGICCGEGQEKDRQQAKGKKRPEIATQRRGNEGGCKKAGDEKQACADEGQKGGEESGEEVHEEIYEEDVN